MAIRVYYGHKVHWRIPCYHCVLRILPVYPQVSLVPTSTLFLGFCCHKHRPQSRRVYVPWNMIEEIHSDRVFVIKL